MSQNSFRKCLFFIIILLQRWLSRRKTHLILIVKRLISCIYPTVYLCVFEHVHSYVCILVILYKFILKCVSLCICANIMQATVYVCMCKVCVCMCISNSALQTRKETDSDSRRISAVFLSTLTTWQFDSTSIVITWYKRSLEVSMSINGCDVRI